MTVKQIFDTMDYGPAPESAAEAVAWIASHQGQFGHWIDGQMTAPQHLFDTLNPATGAILAQVSQGGPADINSAVLAARRAQPKWAALPAHARARALYALARMVQKHARLFAVLETLDNGKPIRETRDIDIPLVARHFYYHAGLAQLRDDELPGHTPLGVVGAIIPWNFPLLMLAWKLAPALAAGNTVVLKPAEYTPLTALLFAQLSARAGLPKGVLNVVTGAGDTCAALVAHGGVDKIAFTGSSQVGREIRAQTAGSGKALTLELGGKSPYIVFDDSDIDSAVEGLVDAIWFNGGQVCCAGSRLLVQEGIADRFYTKLKRRMDGLRIGDPLDKCIDMGAIVHPAQLARITQMVAASEGEIYRAATPLPDGCYYPPTLITGLSTASPLMQEEIFGPILPIQIIQDLDEAIAYIDSKPKPLALYYFGKNTEASQKVLKHTSSGNAVINDCVLHFIHSEIPFGGVNNSGIGSAGGHFGFLAFSHQKGILRQRIGFNNATLLKPPYTDTTKKLIKTMIKWF